MAKNTQTIQISINRNTGCKIKHSWFKQVMISILNEEQIGGNVMVDLLVTGDGQIRQINKKYRGIDRATDVLSFSFVENNMQYGVMEFPLEADGNLYLGEIIISFQRTIDQAIKNGCSVEFELIRLITHGILHLLGYDHKSRADAVKMRERERIIVEKIKRNLEEK